MANCQFIPACCCFRNVLYTKSEKLLRPKRLTEQNKRSIQLSFVACSPSSRHISPPTAPENMTCNKGHNRPRQPRVLTRQSHHWLQETLSLSLALKKLIVAQKVCVALHQSRAEKSKVTH